MAPQEIKMNTAAVVKLSDVLNTALKGFEDEEEKPKPKKTVTPPPEVIEDKEDDMEPSAKTSPWIPKSSALSRARMDPPQNWRYPNPNYQYNGPRYRPNPGYGRFRPYGYGYDRYGYD